MLHNALVRFCKDTINDKSVFISEIDIYKGKVKRERWLTNGTFMFNANLKYIGQGRAWGQNQSTQGVGIGGGVPLPYVSKKIKIWTKRWLLLQFLNLNTDLIVSKTKVKNSQNPIALVQDYYKIGILVM